MRLPFRILVVEDDPKTLSQIVHLLRDANYVVTGAATTDAGKRLLDVGAFDLLVAEGPLEAFNGRVLGHSRFDTGEMALVVLGSDEDGPLAAQARRYGARFIRKPLDPPAFLTSVRQTLQTVRRRRRWERKRVTSGFQVLAHGIPATVLDVCYGGLKLEVERAGDFPDAFDVEIPGIGLHLDVERVWMLPSSDGLGVSCGVALASTATPAARTWRAIVDRLGA